MKRRTVIILRAVASIGMVGQLLLACAVIVGVPLVAARPAEAACTASQPLVLAYSVHIINQFGHNYSGGPPAGYAVCTGLTASAELCGTFSSFTVSNGTLSFNIDIKDGGAGDEAFSNPGTNIFVEDNAFTPPSGQERWNFRMVLLAGVATWNEPPGLYTGAATLNLTEGYNGACHGGMNGYAGTIPMQLQLTVDPLCQITGGPTTMNFGTLRGLVTTAADDKSSSISVQCNLDTPYTLTYGQGGGYLGTSGPRAMQDGAYRLPYYLYLDSAYTTPYPESTGITGTGEGTTIPTLTIYGQIPSGTTLPPPGSYSDTVTTTVSF